MKKIILTVMLASTFSLLPSSSKAQEVSFQLFYSSLSPYGQWVSVADYGTCWRPYGVPMGWRPYTHGHWVWTEYGWTWVSPHPWGWAAFHYGRWFLDPIYGWVWVPGYVWAPAWVEWRWGGGYCGWAPMPPGFHFRVDVVVTGNERDFGVGHGGWNFVRAEEMGSDHYRFVGREAVPRVIGSTRNVTEFRFTSNGVYNTGLPREVVERASHRRIETFSLVRSNTVGRERVEGNRFHIYSPAPVKPAVRDEGAVVRERNRRPQQYHQPENAPARPREREMRPRNDGPKQGPAYQPRGEKQAPPKQEAKPRTNDRGREKDTRHRDHGPGRWH